MKVRSVLSIVLVCLGLVAAILPETKNSSTQLDARQLLNEIQLENNVISVDEIANALINNDPEYQLIDVRTKAEYDLFSLPGAMNIPFDSLFAEKWSPYIDQLARKNVFFSNGTLLASEACILTKQKGYQNNYILSGGLNNWYTTIIEPQEPASTESDDAMFSHQARLGAKQFFTGAGAASNSSSKKKARKPIARKKKKMVAGGCS